MRFTVHLAGVLTLVTVLCVAAFADHSTDRTEVGRHISIAPDQQAGDVTCFGCSVRIRGHVTSDVTVFGGSVILEDQAEVDGDLTTFGGNVRLDEGVKVAGSLVVLGGHLHRASGASVRGDVVNMGSLAALLMIACIPFLIFASLIALIVLLVGQLSRPAVPAHA